MTNFNEGNHYQEIYKEIRNGFGIFPWIYVIGGGLAFFFDKKDPVDWIYFSTLFLMSILLKGFTDVLCKLNAPK